MAASAAIRPATADRLKIGDAEACAIGEKLSYINLRPDARAEYAKALQIPDQERTADQRQLRPDADVMQQRGENHEHGGPQRGGSAQDRKVAAGSGACRAALRHAGPKREAAGKGTG